MTASSRSGKAVTTWISGSRDVRDRRVARGLASGDGDVISANQGRYDGHVTRAIGLRNVTPSEREYRVLTVSLRRRLVGRELRFIPCGVAHADLGVACDLHSRRTAERKLMMAI